MAARSIILRDEHGEDHEVAVTGPDSVTIGDRTFSLRRIRAGQIRVAQHTIWVASAAGRRWAFVDGFAYAFDQQSNDGAPRKRVRHDDSLAAPMPATVIKLHVAPGDEVKAGQLLVVLEAMKMELPVRASGDARVEAVRCAEGELVQAGQSLIELTPPRSAVAESDPK